MNEIFELITKLRNELEACRTGENDTKVMDAVQTLNAIDNKLLKQNDEILSCPYCGSNDIQICNEITGECLDCHEDWAV